ncbi:MAG TPA: TraB/GumN family protein [Methylotenera sp.]|nr:TraB/GumN family protein [Methylotenera sp.]
MRLIAFSFFIVFSFNALALPGMFWKAESASANTIYLFGTIHTDDNRVTDFSPVVISSIKSSDAFMMETLAPNDTSALMMPAGNLKDMLTEAELEKVYALTAFHVMHRNAAMRMKPWLLAAIFDVPRPITPFAQDNLLMAQAEDFGKEVIGIESTAEHFGVMDSISLEEQISMLREVLKRTPEAKERDYERLVQAYLKGDSEKLARLNAEITGNSMPADLWARMRVKLLDERNALMAERVLAAAKTKKLFVGVGASHLAGEGGLIERLKKAGFKLSPVK